MRMSQARFAHKSVLLVRRLAGAAPFSFCPVLQFGLRFILNCKGYAHAPLENDMGDLCCPISFLYGADDFMDRSAAERVAETLAKGQVSVYSVPECGHMLIL